MLTSGEFLEKIEKHLADTATKPSRFGKAVLGDPNFVFELRSGRKPNLEVVAKVLDVIDATKSAAPQPEKAA